MDERESNIKQRHKRELTFIYDTEYSRDLLQNLNDSMEHNVMGTQGTRGGNDIQCSALKVGKDEFNMLGCGRNV